MRDRFVPIVISFVLVATACGDDTGPKDPPDPDMNVVEADAGTDASDDAGADAGVECDEDEVPFEGACVSIGLDTQVTVVSDELYSISSAPFDVTAQGMNTTEPFNDFCSVITEDTGTAPELPTCYDAGLLTVQSSSSTDPIELGYLEDCYSIEPDGGFASSGDDITLDFAGGADSGPVSLSRTLPQTPVFDVTAEPDGGLTFVTTNPNSGGDLFISFTPMTPNGTTVSCFLADGETLELTSEDVAFIETTLGDGISTIATYADSEAATSGDAYISLTAVSFNVSVYAF